MRHNKRGEIHRDLTSFLHESYALLFGSYARGEATPESDIDIIIVGGERFTPRIIFALAEDLRELSGRSADVFEIRESILQSGCSFHA